MAVKLYKIQIRIRGKGAWFDVRPHTEGEPFLFTDEAEARKMAAIVAGVRDHCRVVST